MRSQKKRTIYALEHPEGGMFWDGNPWRDGPDFSKMTSYASQMEAEQALIVYNVTKRLGTKAWAKAPETLHIIRMEIDAKPLIHIISDHDAIVDWISKFDKLLKDQLDHKYMAYSLGWKRFWTQRLSGDANHIRYCVQFDSNWPTDLAKQIDLLEECEIEEGSTLIHRDDFSRICGFKHLTDVVMLKMRDCIPIVIYDLVERRFITTS